MSTDYRPETLCVQAGYTPGKGEARILPIYQSTTFKYDTSEQMGKLFDLEDNGYFYTRLANPTNDAVAAKICALEGGVAAMLTSSGQAANYYAVFNICECGDHVIMSSCIYGGTFNLLTCTMKKMGIECTVIDPFYALNKKGESKPILEESWADADSPVTHAIMMISSSSCGAFTGALDNVLWVDNVRLEY